MKQREISQMFSNIAKRYDFLNHLLSFGLDFIWRKKLISLAKVKPGDLILDVATGTGDVAIGFARRYKNINVTGVDFSNSMLEIAKKKTVLKGKIGPVDFKFGNALKLPFNDNKFDVVTCVFGIRNVKDSQKGIKEMSRVVKKGGLVLIMEFSKPNNLVAPFYWGYLKLIIPTVGAIFSKKAAYSYLSNSIWQFVKTVNIVAEMKFLGLIRIKHFPLTFGVVSIYIGEKP